MTDDGEVGKNTKCGTCEEILQKKCLCCDICNKLICCTCLNVNNKLFNVLNDTKINSTALLVACQKCRTSTFKVIKNEINQKSTMLENNNKFEDMVHRFEKLSTKVENNMKKLEGLESLNESIKQAPEKLKTTYAEMANKGNITQIDRDTIKHSVKMALKESKYEEGKGNNAIMYNCPEPNINNKDERMEKELETINNFLTEGVKIGSMKIINAYRLGKYNDTKQGRPRPLRIIFEEKNAI